MDVAGRIPECGAIFMSNIATKRECLKYKVFGLPASQAKFVKQVKAGMILFLFENERRELFGVYQACSNGAMDIIPQLCKKLGMKFPAQVKFRPIWYCNPLPEREFREAIYDNYFSPKKFNFGLSEDQVHRLLQLFSSRKFKNKLLRQPSRAVGEERRMMDDDRGVLVKRADMRSCEGDMDESGKSYDYLGNSLNRSKESEDDILFIEDGIGKEDEPNSVPYGSLTNHTSQCTNRTDKDDRLLRNDLAENILKDDCANLNSFCRGGREDTLVDVSRFVNGGRLLTGELVNDKFHADSDLDPINFKEYRMGPLDVELDNGKNLMMRNRTVGRFDTEAGFGSAYPTEHSEKSLNWDRFGITGDRYLIADIDEKEYNHHQYLEPLVSNVPNLDKRLVNRHGMVSCPVTESECFGSHLHKLKNTTGDGWLAINERLGGEHNVSANLGPGFLNPLNSDCRNINDANILASEGGIIENLVDGIRCSTTFKNSEYVTSVDGRVFNNGRFRNDNQVEIGEGVDTFTRPVMTEYTALSKMMQNSPDYLNSSYSTCADATIERVIPYIPELTRSPDQLFSFAPSGNSRSVKQNPSHASGRNHYSLSKSGSPAHGLEAKGLIRPLDIASAYRNNAVLSTISDYPIQHSHGTSRYSLNEGLSSHVDLKSSAYLGHSGSLFPNPSSVSLPSSRSDSSEREKRSASHALNRMEKPTFGKGGNFPLMSEDIYPHVIYPDVDKTSSHHDFHKQDLSSATYHQENGSLNYDNEDFKSLKDTRGHNRRSKTPSKESNSNRKSVFSRLTTGPVGHSQEQEEEEEENNNYVDCDESYMDSSVKEVMDLLQQKFKNRVREGKKIKKSNKRSRSGCDFGESGVDERQDLVESKIEIDQSTVTREMEDEYGAIGETSNEVPKETRIVDFETSNEVPKETRIVDFKRRSETKKKLIKTNTKTNPSTGEDRTSISGMNAEVDNLGDKSCKRRKKLVRPVFAKNDSVNEGVISNPDGNSDTIPNVQESEILYPVFAKNGLVDEGVVGNPVDKSDTIPDVKDAEILNPVFGKNDLVDEGVLGNTVDKSDTITNVQEAEILNPVFATNDSADEGVVGNPVDKSETIPNLQEAEILNPDTHIEQLIF